MRPYDARRTTADWHRGALLAALGDRMTQQEATPRVTILGSGFGGLEAAFYLRKRLGQRVDLTVVSDRDEFLFTPHTIYVPFGKAPAELLLPLGPVFETKQIHFLRASARAIDAPSRRVETTEGSVPFDVLVVATGAATRAAEIPGLEAHADTIGTTEDLTRLRESFDALLHRARRGEQQRVVFVVPPNNQSSGPLYELVFMLDTWLRRAGLHEWIDIRYATHEARFIEAFGPRLHDVVATEFRDRGISGATHRVVRAVEPRRVVYTDETADPFDLLVSFPPYVASTRFEGLPIDDRGFLRVDAKTRQVLGHDDIYAVGDASDFPVKQAFLALLEADAAAEHVAQRLLGEEPSAAFEPVSMCIMDQFDKATFAQVPLRLTGDPTQPVDVREEALEQYRVGTGSVWRLGKKMLGAVISERFGAGRPFHAGATWSVMEAGLKVMTSAFAD
jgi:NADH dehydrogenase FAD-containing subunit